MPRPPHPPPRLQAIGAPFSCPKQLVWDQFGQRVALCYEHSVVFLRMHRGRSGKRGKKGKSATVELEFMGSANFPVHTGVWSGGGFLAVSTTQVAMLLPRSHGRVLDAEGEKDAQGRFTVVPAAPAADGKSGSLHEGSHWHQQLGPTTGVFVLPLAAWGPSLTPLAETLDTAPPTLSMPFPCHHIAPISRMSNSIMFAMMPGYQQSASISRSVILRGLHVADPTALGLLTLSDLAWDLQQEEEGHKDHGDTHLKQRSSALTYALQLLGSVAPKNVNQVARIVAVSSVPPPWALPDETPIAVLCAVPWFPSHGTTNPRIIA